MDILTVIVIAVVFGFVWVYSTFLDKRTYTEPSLSRDVIAQLIKHSHEYIEAFDRLKVRIKADDLGDKESRLADVDVLIEKERSFIALNQHKAK